MLILNWRCGVLAAKSVRNVRLLRFSTAPKPVLDIMDDSKMLAWQIHSYGGLEELQLSKSFRVPKIKSPDDVLVEVAASSVNPIDVAMMNGYGSTILNGLRQAEACSISPIIEFPLTLGRDFSGRVIGKGHNVGNNFNIGDDVWGVLPPHRQGSHAQRVLISQSLIHKKPTNLTHLEASSILYAGVTAWSALKITGDLFLTPARGKNTLVLGGSGGVGTIAVQLLKAWGANVVTTCRTDATPLLEALGADRVIDYTLPDHEQQIKEEGKYDIILDAAGIGSDKGPNYAKYLKDFKLSKYITLKSPLLRNFDDYGIVGGMVKNAVDLIVPNIKTGTISTTSSVRWGFFFPAPGSIEEISSLVEQGKVCPSIERVYPFSDLPAAFERVKCGHLRGKIVIDGSRTNEAEEEKHESQAKMESS
ncbi:reticulon-4-interacting protein 1 homolog, mitochondrial [Anabrus simplex]|uniref:reticulon-4-interacting protein 1 homolog, mitochondrial n=1 Tax=Anabrus simplex TaxID=316456 RepID=UPI0035A33004